YVPAFNVTTVLEIYALSLHDALPISEPTADEPMSVHAPGRSPPAAMWPAKDIATTHTATAHARTTRSTPRSGEVTAISLTRGPRSEEHTSELQSRFDLVCRLLLEKKK